MWYRDISQPSERLKTAAILSGAMLLSAAAAPRALADQYTYYVGTHLAHVEAKQSPETSEPRPVHLVLKFRRGNAEHTDVEQLLHRHVTETVNTTGALLVVEDPSTATDGTLTIALEHIAPVAANTAKSVVSGLSFGLIGSTYTNRYVCTAQYHAHAGGNLIVGKAEHVIYITQGLKKPPPDSERASNFPAALAKMSRQVVTEALRDLAADPSFSAVPR